MWQPIPIHTVSQEQDFVLLGYGPCPKYYKAVGEQYARPLVKFIEMQDADVLEYLTTNSGLRISGLRVRLLFSIIYFCSWLTQAVTKTYSDAVVIELQNNRTLASFLQNQAIIDKLVAYRDLWFNLSLATPEMARMAGGLLVEEITQQMNQRAMGAGFEHVIYSAHDLTVGALFTALGHFIDPFPYYTSAIIFELHLLESVRNFSPFHCYFIFCNKHRTLILSRLITIMVMGETRSLCPFQIVQVFLKTVARLVILWQLPLTNVLSIRRNACFSISDTLLFCPLIYFLIVIYRTFFYGKCLILNRDNRSKAVSTILAGWCARFQAAATAAELERI